MFGEMHSSLGDMYLSYICLKEILYIVSPDFRGRKMFIMERTEVSSLLAACVLFINF